MEAVQNSYRELRQSSKHVQKKPWRYQNKIPKWQYENVYYQEIDLILVKAGGFEITVLLNTILKIVLQKAENAVTVWLQVNGLTHTIFCDYFKYTQNLITTLLGLIVNHYKLF